MHILDSIVAAWRRAGARGANKDEDALRDEILADKVAYKNDSRHIFFAGTTDVEYLAEARRVVDDMLAGKFAMAEGRYRLSKKLKQLGYEPPVGIPDDMAVISPIERGSRQGQSSYARITLVLETNERIAANYRRMVEGNSSYVLYAYPAWELVRLLQRDAPRGSAKSNSPGWKARWRDAGKSCNWDGAIKSRMIARKDSPIWQALGDGAGGYWDALGNPFPPFAIGSGMAWRTVDRDESLELGLSSADESRGPLTPDEQEVVKIFDALPPDEQEELREELRRGLIENKESLRKSRAEFARSEDAAAAERHAQIPEMRRKQQEWINNFGLLVRVEEIVAEMEEIDDQRMAWLWETIKHLTSTSGFDGFQDVRPAAWIAAAKLHKRQGNLADELGCLEQALKLNLKAPVKRRVKALKSVLGLLTEK